MAFAQLTYRESLRDIETCLSVHASKLYHMGFRQPVRRSTLADANERRDWRIHAALAQRLITQARTLYVDEELGLDLTNTVYALDSTTIALCLSVFPWAHFRTTKAAVKMHTLLDLRGNIPSFIHISDGKLHDVHALDMLLPEAGAIYVVDRGYVDFARLYVLHQAGAFFVTRAKSNIDAHRVYSAPTDRSTGIICDQTISLDGFYTRQDYPELLRRIRFKDPESGKTLVFITNNFSLPAATICTLYKSRWQVEPSSGSSSIFGSSSSTASSENAVKLIWIAAGLRPRRHLNESASGIHAALAQLTQARTLSSWNLRCGATFPRMASCTTCPRYVAAVEPEIYVVDRGYVDPLCVAPSRGLLRHACQVEQCSSRLFGADGSLDRHHLRPDHLPGRLLHPSGLPRTSAAHASRTPSPARRWSSSPTTSRFRPPICALYKSRWQVELFFKWIKQHLRIKQFYGTSENAVKTQIWIAVSVYVLVAIVNKRLDLDASLYTLLQILSVTLFEKMPIHQALAGDENRCNASQITNQLNLFDF